MARLLIHVEGQTEEDFVNEVLKDHLKAKGFDTVAAHIVGNARLRRQRGGIRPWPSVKKDIIHHLREDPACIATTMVDYYGLPQQAAAAWPGRANATSLETEAKASTLESAIRDDIGLEMGGRFDRGRFVPFVVMHEFEGLLFSDCAAFGRGINHPELESSFKSIREQFTSPEDINDSPITAPSKRIAGLLPEYQKPFHGVLAILEIGLHRIRAECAHFDMWLKRLESLVR